MPLLPHAVPISKMAAGGISPHAVPVPEMAAGGVTPGRAARPQDGGRRPGGSGAERLRLRRSQRCMPGVLPAVTLHIAPGTATGARGHGGREGDRQRYGVPARAERRRLPPGRGEVHHEGVSEGGMRLPARRSRLSLLGWAPVFPWCYSGFPGAICSVTRLCDHGISAFICCVIFSTVFPVLRINSPFSRLADPPALRRSEGSRAALV